MRIRVRYVVMCNEGVLLTYEMIQWVHFDHSGIVQGFFF